MLRGLHGKHQGISVDSIGVEGRENESREPTKTCGRGSCSFGQVERREFLHKTETRLVSFCSQEDESVAEGTVGKGSFIERPSSPWETEAHDVSNSPQEDCSCTASEMGKSESSTEEGRLTEEWSSWKCAMFR